MNSLFKHIQEWYFGLNVSGYFIDVQTIYLQMLFLPVGLVKWQPASVTCFAVSYFCLELLIFKLLYILLGVESLFVQVKDNQMLTGPQVIQTSEV